MDDTRADAAYGPRWRRKSATGVNDLGVGLTEDPGSHAKLELHGSRIDWSGELGRDQVAIHIRIDGKAQATVSLQSSAPRGQAWALYEVLSKAG